MAKKKSKTVEDYSKDWKSNPFRKPKIEKVVVNIAVGQAGEELNKASKVLEILTQRKPVALKAKKSVKEWNVRQGQSIAVKVTLRGNEGVAFLKKVLFVTDNRILKKSFDNFGNFSMGIDEHIKLPKVKYIPELGIIGFDVAVRIARPGLRVKVRRKQRSKIPKHHYVSKKEAIFFMEQELKVEIVDVMEERYY
ncbi:MAG: 50S ribosomal protein L5 [archaeon]|nr:50S ribosomal protein L5 [archaeon]